MSSLELSTTKSATIRVTEADRKSNQNASQRVPQLNSMKWFELVSLSILNLSLETHKQYVTFNSLLCLLHLFNVKSTYSQLDY